MVACRRVVFVAGKGHLHEQQRGLLEIEAVGGIAQVRTRLEVIDFLLVD